MSTRIVAWSFGLLAVSSLAGCGWGRECRHSTCHGAVASRTSSGRAIARNRKLAPAMTIDTTQEPADELPQTPIAGAKKDEDVALPFENTLVPIPIPSQDREDVASTLKEIERLLPMSRGQDKIVVLSVDDAKPAASAIVASEKITSADTAEADLENALNRLAGKKETGNNAKLKLVPMDSTHSYGQADNYQQLTGQLQFWRKTLRLRYAAVSEEETHGGSVVLEGIGDPSKLRDGQHLRVRGRLIPADNRQDSPRYVVQSIEALD